MYDHSILVAEVSGCVESVAQNDKADSRVSLCELIALAIKIVVAIIDGSIGAVGSLVDD